MSGDGGAVRARWRPVCGWALGLGAAWLVVQNGLVTAVLLLAGPEAAWHTLAPILGVAFVLMTPLWLVPALLLFAGRHTPDRDACHGTHEVTR